MRRYLSELHSVVHGDRWKVKPGREAKPQEPERVQETQSSHKGLSLGEVDMA